MEQNFPVIPIFRNIGTSSRGTPKIPKWDSGKCPFHSLFTRSFRNFWSNGKRPRTSRYSAHTLSQVWQIWLVLVSIYCVYKAIQKRNVVGPGQRSWFSVLTKRIAAYGDENGAAEVSLYCEFHQGRVTFGVVKTRWKRKIFGRNAY